MPAPLTPGALPILQPHVRTIVMPPNDILLISDVDELRLTGELFAALAEHLDGQRTVDEITDIMVAAGTATSDEVPAAIEILRDRGYLVDARSFRDDHQLYRLWHGEESMLPSIAVHAFGDVPHGEVEQALRQHGLSVADPVEADMHVFVVDDYLHPDLQLATESFAPALLLRPTGVRPTIGPWLGAPGPCWECLAVRLVFNRQVEVQAVEAVGAERIGPVARGWTPATAAHMGTEAALAVLRVNGELSERSALLVIDHVTGERTEHIVVRRPQCRSCGTPREHRAIELSSGALNAKDDGSYRLLTPQQTLDVFGHHVSPVTGVVEHLIRTNRDDDLLHVVESGVNLANTRKGAKACGFRQSAGGKGTTAIQARAGALAEAIERFSATYCGDEVKRAGRMGDFGAAAIDPRACMLFSDRQYRDREAWNAAHKSMHRVPPPFDPDLERDWSPLWSLTTGEERWLPTAYCYYLYAGSMQRIGTMADSNGNAAGTSLEDAILQGSFELIERDAVSVWWYNELLRPGVDLEAYAKAFDEPYFTRVVEHYERVLDRELWVLDLTHDIGIPAFAAVSRARSGLPRVLMGFGAHRDPRGAVLRAITEMNQMLGMVPALEAGGVPEVFDPTQPEVMWWYTEDLADHPYVVPDPQQPLTTPDVHSHDWGLDGKENVERMIQVFASRGLEMSVLDMTHPDLGMPVVKVVVPGIRHFWPRFAPGRLYDVPVEMGWRNRARTEAELNSTPIFW